MPGRVGEFIDPKTVGYIEGKPPITMMVVHPPTDRYVLWIIAQKKEAFNIKYFGQFITAHKDQNEKIKKIVEVASVLKVRGLARVDKDGNWHITRKGQIFRLTTHPSWDFIKYATATIIAIAALTLAYLNYSKKDTANRKEPKQLEAHPN